MSVIILISEFDNRFGRDVHKSRIGKNDQRKEFLTRMEKIKSEDSKRG